jgi:hypothetical protein
MTKTATGLEPVLVALETIELTSDVSFAGIDLETGTRVSISVSRDSASKPTLVRKFLAAGLVLRLTIEPIDLAT